MVRKAMAGAEGVLIANYYELGSITGTVTRDTAIYRKAPGVASYKCDSTGSNAIASFGDIGSLTSSGWYYGQAWFYFDNLPSTTTDIVRQYYSITPTGFAIRLDSSGNVTLWRYDGGGSQVGSAYGTALSTGTWYRINYEYQMTLSYNVTDVKAYVNGTNFASLTGVYINCSASPNWGWCTAPGASKVCHVDDVVANGSASGTLTGKPDADEVVFALWPASDNTVDAGWTKPGGGATNLYTSVNNNPPVGIADTTSATYAENQIRNATTGTDNYKANMQTYTAAGLVATDTVTAVFMGFETAVASQTSPKSGSVSLTNPTIALTSFSSFNAGANAGTWPTGWKRNETGGIQEMPSVTFGTAPVMTIQQTTSSTRIALISAMFLIATKYGLSTVSATFPVNAVIKRTMSSTFKVDAVSAAVALALAWVDPPADTVAMAKQPTLTFQAATGAGPMRFQIQLDTADTFDTANLRTYGLADGTWEYFDSTWTAMPASGIPDGKTGCLARFTVPVDLANGTWYRRIRYG